MKSQLSLIGQHALLDLYGINPVVACDTVVIEEILLHAAQLVGATVLNSYFHSFGENQGVTGVLLLSESHISIHTWPEHGFAAVDLFMCGDVLLKKAADYLIDALQATSYQWQQMNRGHQV
ncbi:adenosylmethionine decarboxylase [Neisseria sp. Ec49-e6-T10]|uniref:adenosylmethionine decarboxylase n=1 Tax=Neisseria sp. Ec49-e6-T10 TaxID=3140744 RepID=UPI003EBC7D58